MARRILIIDDQEDILLILEREFRRVAGLSVITTNNVADVMETIATKQIDLVISDVRIKTDSGFDLVRQINQTYPDVGSILMSAYRSASNRQQAEELGVVLFLEKPFPIAKLIAEVNAYFERKENPPPVVEEPPAPSTEESSALVHFKLQDLVQLFCLNGRNILITVNSGVDEEVGEIYVQKGSVIHAEYKGTSGDAGFHALMKIPNPVLKVKDWTAPVPVTIQTSWVHLLLEAAVQHDHQPDRQASGLG